MREPAGMTKACGAILRRLAAYRRCQRWAQLERGALEALAVLIAGLIAVAAVDGAVKPDAWVQVGAGTGVYVLAGLVLAWRGLWLACRRRSHVALAREVERKLEGDTEERLSSALELAEHPPPGVSAWMIDRTIALAAREFAGLDPAGLIETGPVRRRARVAGGLLIALFALLVLPPVRPLVLRALLPGINLPRPSATHLEVEPEDQALAAGLPVTIRAAAAPAPEAATIRVAWEDGLSETLRMHATGEAGRFRLRFPALMQGFAYTVHAGDAESRHYRITLKRPPRLRGVQLRVVPPAYTEREPRIVSGGDAEVLAGSRIRIVAALEGPGAVSASLLREPGGRIAMRIKGDRATCSWKAETTVRYRLRLVGVDGLTAEPPQQWCVRVTPDAPPVVRLTGPGLEAGVAGHDETLVLDLAAEDDLGLRNVDILLEREGVETRIRSLVVGKSRPRRLERAAAVDLAALVLAPQQTVRLVLSARDLGGQAARSEPLELVLTEGVPAGTVQAAARLRRVLETLRRQERRLERQHRDWSELVRVFRPEDPDAQRGTLLVNRDELEQSTAAVGRIAERMGREAPRLEVGFRSSAFALSEMLAAWAERHGAVLSEAAREACRKRRKDAVPLATTRDLIEAASRALRGLSRQTGLLVARLEAKGLVVQAQAARERQARTVAVLQGFHGWGWHAREPLGPWEEDAAKRAALARKMSALPRHVLEGAATRLSRDYSLLGAVPEAIARMAEDARNPKLRKLAWQSAKPAKRMAQAVEEAAAGGWTAGALARTSQLAAPLARQARRARDILDEAMQRSLAGLVAPVGRVDRLRYAVKDLAARAKRLPARVEQGSPAEQEALLERERQVLAVGLGHVERAADDARQSLRASAADPRRPLAERQAAFAAARQLADPVRTAVAEAQAAAGDDSADPQQLGQRRAQALKALDRALETAGSREADAQKSREAALAGRAARAQAARARADRRADPLTAHAAFDDLQKRVQDLAAAWQKRGRFQDADELRRALGESPDVVRPDALGKALSEPLRAAPKSNPWRMGRELDARTEQLRDPKAAGAVQEALADTRLKLDLAAASLHVHGRPAEGRVYAQTAEDLAALLDQPEPLTPEALVPLAERIASLENRKDGGRREQALAAAEVREAERAETDGRLQAARALDAASRHAEAGARDARQRPALAAHLRALVGRAEEDAAAARALEEAAAMTGLVEQAMRDEQALAAFARALQEAGRDMQAARARFAEAEERISRELQALAPAFGEQAEARHNAPLQHTLERVRKQIPQAAQNIAGLAVWAREAGVVGEASDRAASKAAEARPRSSQLKAQAIASQAKQAGARAADAVARADEARERAQDEWDRRQRAVRERLEAEAERLAAAQVHMRETLEEGYRLTAAVPEDREQDRLTHALALAKAAQQALSTLQQVQVGNRSEQAFARLADRAAVFGRALEDLAHGSRDAQAPAERDAARAQVTRAAEILQQAARQMVARAPEERLAETDVGDRFVAEALDAEGAARARGRSADPGRANGPAAEFAPLGREALALAAAGDQAIRNRARPRAEGTDAAPADQGTEVRIAPAVLAERARAIEDRARLALRAEAGRKQDGAQAVRDQIQGLAERAGGFAVSASAQDEARLARLAGDFRERVARAAEQAAGEAEAMARNRKPQRDDTPQRALEVVRAARQAAERARTAAAQALRALEPEEGAADAANDAPDRRAVAIPGVPPAQPLDRACARAAEASAHAARAGLLSRYAARLAGTLPAGERKALAGVRELAEATRLSEQRMGRARRLADRERAATERLREQQVWAEMRVQQSERAVREAAEKAQQAQGQKERAARGEDAAEQALGDRRQEARAMRAQAARALERAAVAEQAVAERRAAALEQERRLLEALRRSAGDKDAAAEDVENGVRALRQAVGGTAEDLARAEQATRWAWRVRKQVGQQSDAASPAMRGAMRRMEKAIRQSAEQRELQASAHSALAEQTDRLASEALKRLERKPADSTRHARAVLDVELAAAARAQADRLRDGLAQPLAEAFRSASRKLEEEEGARAVGALGRRLAALAAAQQQAVRALEAQLQRRSRLQDTLAEVLPRMAERVERLEGAAARHGGIARQAQRGLAADAEAVQHKADRSQEQADRAARAVEAGQRHATQLAQEAERAQGDQAAVAEKQAAEAAQQTRALREKTVEAQTKALEAQQEALDLLRRQAPDARPALQALERAARNLAQARTNASQTLDHSASPARRPLTLGEPDAQAAKNRRLAAAGLEAVRSRQHLAAERLRARLQQAAFAARKAAAQAVARSAMPGLQETLRGETEGPAAGEAADETAHAGKPGGSGGAAAAKEAVAGEAAGQALARVESAPADAHAYEEAARALARGAAQARQGASSGASSPAQASAPAGQGGGGTAARGPAGDVTSLPPAGEAAGAAAQEADWSRLPERLRTQIRRGAVHQFAEEHQEMIRAYFRRLGEEDR